eukprot:CAMPEP_0172682516 /NCGR_PEP_ID=MMETSP1074-20121228/18222_1 /TAXON_ID=2916 /ORGANISM="Ceratium fusus, Strain PA161109" /LENGTH=524 /DNA_ID=CAMNT_0013501213 /DNA_START=167 /DNA_END=1741 /DNA_ORIENTATION=-
MVSMTSVTCLGVLHAAQAWATRQRPSMNAAAHRRHGSSTKMVAPFQNIAGPRFSRAAISQIAAHADSSNQDNRVFFTSYIAYASCYLARNNAAVAKAPLLGALGIGASMALFGTSDAMSATTALGILDGAFLLAYTLGSFIVPAAIDLDKRSPWEVMWIFLAIAGLAQLGLWWGWSFLLVPHFALSEFSFVCTCCLINGAAQSVLYPACKQALADTFGANGTVLGAWNTCFYLGGAVSTLIAATLCDMWGWSAAFLGSSLLLFAIVGVGLVVASWLPPLPIRNVRNSEKTSSGSAGGGTSDRTWRRMQRLIWPEDEELRRVAFNYFVVKLVRYVFGLWLPLLLAATWDVQNGGSLLGVGATAAIFEMGSVLGSVAIGYLVEQVGLDALPMLVVGATAALSFLLRLVPDVLVGNAENSLGTWSLLLLLGLFTGGGETLLGSISPIFYAQKAEGEGSTKSVASAVASINGYGSLGTVFAAVALPLLANGSDAMGLANAFQSLSPLALVATCIGLLQIGRRQAQFGS